MRMTKIALVSAALLVTMSLSVTTAEAYGGYYGHYGHYGHYGYGYGYGYGHGYGYAFDNAYREVRAKNGRVQIKVDQKNAQVFVDDALAGTVDDFDGRSRLYLRPGKYVIEIRLPGFLPMSRTLHASPGKKVTIRGDMKPLPIGVTDARKPIR